MSTNNVARVLKKIKDEYHKDNKKYPEYYSPFFDNPIDLDIFDLVRLFEEIKKKGNYDDCQFEHSLYKYLSKDKSKHADDSYVQELESLLLK